MIRVRLRTVTTRPVLKKFRLSTPIENQGLNTSDTAWEKNLSMRVGGEIIIDFDSASESPWISRNFCFFSSIYMIFLIQILLRRSLWETTLNFEIFLRHHAGQKFNFFRALVRMPKSFSSSTAKAARQKQFNHYHQRNQQARKVRFVRPPPN
jgi:hypothetical protein